MENLTSQTLLDTKMISAGRRSHIFFDMDGTLTESREAISKEMMKLINQLAPFADIGIISGAVYEQMQKQIPFIEKQPLYAMAQTGNDTRFGNRSMWINRLPYELIPHIEESIKQIMQSPLYRNSLINMEPVDTDDLVEFRGAQVSFSMIGHNANKDKKKVFDPSGMFRQECILMYPPEDSRIEVRVGGTTCLDYTKVGWNKAGNIDRLLQWKGWRREDCIYVGDALRPGGNDEVMRDVMTCVEVRDPHDTMNVIRDLIQMLYEAV